MKKFSWLCFLFGHDFYKVRFKKICDRCDQHEFNFKGNIK